jgi:hypothetical protein
MLEVKHVGGRTHPVTGDQYNAFEVTTRVGTARDPWPLGPLFPVGHTLFTSDGKAYEVVSSRTVEHETVFSRQIAYQYSYLCRAVDPRSL